MNRSQFVTYWTGKDIEKENPSNKTDEYFDRLWSILDEGIWMNLNDEISHGWDVQWGKASDLIMTIPMVCFTELRLSQSKTHYTKYGHLGYVFDRQFVLDRLGAPVLYVRSHYHENIVGNLAQIGMIITILKQNRILLQDQSNPGAPPIDLGDFLDKTLSLPIAHIKAMSTPYKDDFIYLEENEWRIVHSVKLEQSGLIYRTEQEPPPYKLPFSSKDIKMIIVPNLSLRNQMRSKKNIIDWFDGVFPPILTVDEISEF